MHLQRSLVLSILFRGIELDVPISIRYKLAMDDLWGVVVV
jgi:hypothetical protein